MGQNTKPGLAGESDYIPPKKPGEMHKHAVRGMLSGRVIGSQDEGEAQKGRNSALAHIKSTNPQLAKWDPRDINLPVEKKPAKRSASRRVASKR